MQVLLVEDDALTRRLLERALVARGHTVDAFERAEPALEAYRAAQHPLCVTDWLLPGLSGLELCRAIRAMPASDRTVVLVVTVLEGSDDLREILDAGASDYLAKPIQPGLFDVRLAVAERHARQLAERQRIEEEAQRLHATLDAIADGIYILDPGSQRLGYVNQGAAHQLGHAREALLAMRLADILPGATRDLIDGLGSTGTRTALVKLRQRDGSMLPVEAFFQLVSPRDAPPRVVVVARDIRERLHAEEALRAAEKLEGLGALAGGIAHDFNNLLVGVLGNAGLALMDLKPGTAAFAALEHIEQAARRAAGLCMQLLAYSGRGRLFVERTDLSALVRDSQALLEAAVRGQASGLDLDLDDRLPAVEVDTNQVRHAILNLVVNAGEATAAAPAVPSAAARVTIRTGVMDADRAYLAGTYLDDDLTAGTFVFLEVEDRGCGIEPQHRPRVFDPFFSTKFTGRGLGLASVLGVVRSHKGAIRLDSEPGAGTRVRLLLPPALGPDGGPLPAVRPSAERPRVLLVDDEPAVRHVTERILAALGFDVATAEDGEEAVEVFRARRGWVDVVLLDLAMPRLSGDRAFHAIRALDPGARVVLMSGYGESEVARRMRGAGIAGFLQKPFTPKDLEQALRKALGQGAEPLGASG